MKKIYLFILFLLLGLLLPLNSLNAQEEAEEQSVFRPTPARPSDLIRIPHDAEGNEEDTEENLVSSVEDNREENRGITDYSNLIYTAFIIPEEDVEAFLDFMSSDEDIIGQIEIEEIDSEEYDGQAFIAEYGASASEAKQPILFSANTQYETEEEAVEFGEGTLTIYPDLFFDYEVYEAEGLYDVLFGIRVNADTTVIWYNDDEEMIQYNATRPKFTYQVAEGEEDPYQEIIEENFPGEFEFNSETTEDNNTEVTMIHTNSPYEQTENVVDSEGEDINEDESQEEDSIDLNTEETSESMLDNGNDSNDETRTSASSQSVEQSNTDFLGFRDNIMSFLNDRNITSDNALIYLIGGFVLLIGLMLLVVGKR